MIYAENILLCIAIPLVISLLYIRGNTMKFVVSFLVGMCMCLLAAYITGFIDTFDNMSAKDTAIFISPFVEEIMKMMPVLLYLFMLQPEDDDLMRSAVGVGTGFAIYENCCFILTEGAGSLSYILIRGMAVGVMHIVSIIAFAFGLSFVRRVHTLTFAGIAGALSLSASFHGLYNLLVSKPGITSVMGFALPIATALLMTLVYRRFRKDPSDSI